MKIISFSNTSNDYILEDDYYIKETKSFKFICYEERHDYMYDIEKNLENNYEKVISDLGLRENAPQITVKVYPTLKEFHDSIALLQGANYVVGKTISEKEFRMVSPKDSGLVHTYNQIVNGVAIHEFAHSITYLVTGNKRLPLWLQESIALYEAGQKIIPNKLPNSFKEIREMKYNIYKVGYLLIEYLVENYGKEVISELLFNKGDIEKVIDKEEDEFFNVWLEYIQKYYFNKNKK